jgi:hypothetical protein
MTVKRDIGRIQIQHHFSRRACVGLDVQIGQQSVHSLSRIVDLVITGAAASQLQPVQRALTC